MIPNLPRVSLYNVINSSILNIIFGCIHACRVNTVISPVYSNYNIDDCTRMNVAT